MSDWRIDIDSRRWPVVLTMHGIDYCMSIPDAMALLRAAPKMGARWDDVRRDGEGTARANIDGQCLAVVYGRANGPSDDDSRKWEIWDRNVCKRSGRAESLQAAKDAADAALRAAGWLLEEG